MAAVGHRNHLSFYTSHDTTVGSLTEDRWIVFVCDVTGSDGQPRLNDPSRSSVSPEEYAEMFKEHATPFFEWVSRGQYRPVFTPGVTVDARIGAGDGTDRASVLCELNARQAFDEMSNPPEVRGAVIVTRTTCGGYVCGYASDGGYSAQQCLSSNTATCENEYWVTVGEPEPDLDWRVEPSGDGLYPLNSRIVWVAGHSNTLISAVIHELGHALGWPHSFSGETDDEYDNGTDFMSGALTVEDIMGEAPRIATHVYNIYSAGWLHPHEITVHVSGTRTYELCDVFTGDTACLKMLVLPSADGSFEVLGARTQQGYDTGITREGVEHYQIVQTTDNCYEPDTAGVTLCHTATRVKQAVHEPETITIYKPPDNTGWISRYTTEVSTAHLYAPGETFESDGRTVTITQTRPDTFEVAVLSSVQHQGRFADDDNNPHEAAIEHLANTGVAQGCAAILFCPDGSVTRAQMAAFLVRAVGTQNASTHETLTGFSDVPADAWYAEYVDELQRLGVTRGYQDGTFRPNVEVTRALMATFLARAFRVDIPSALPSVFADVKIHSVHAPAIAALAGLGIIEGCDTAARRFCPDTALRRDEMAAWMVAIMRGAHK